MEFATLKSMSRKNLVSYNRIRKQYTGGPQGQYFMSAAPVFTSNSDTHVRMSSSDHKKAKFSPEVQFASQKVIESIESVSQNIIDKIHCAYERNRAESNLMIVFGVVMLGFIMLLGRIVH